MITSYSGGKENHGKVIFNSCSLLDFAREISCPNNDNYLELLLAFQGYFQTVQGQCADIDYGTE